MNETVIVRNATPAEYERVGDMTVAAYAALPVDHLWDGYDDEIRDVAGRAMRPTCSLPSIDEVVRRRGHVSSPIPTSRWLEWTEPGEAQFRLLAVDPAVQGRGIGETARCGV